MTSKITGAEYLARSLEAYGVSAVFFVPTILSRTLYELEARTGVRRILTHGEKAAVYMADGYARASGRPGVCMAQTVGAANLAAGLRDPYLGCSPVLALTGGPYNWSRGRSYYQEIEDFPLFKPVTKFSAQVSDAGRLPDLLAYAFAAATSGQPGPVHLEVAGHSGEDVEDGETDAPVPAPQPATVPRLRTRPDTGAVAAAAQLLRAASRPVIVAGGGVRASGAEPELLAYAEHVVDLFGLRPHIRLNTAVQEVVWDAATRQYTVTASDGSAERFDAVVSAVPLPHFVRLAPGLPEAYRAALAAIEYIGVVCVVLRLRHPISESFWLNVNDERVPFNGCIEYTNLNPGATPDGSSILYVPFYLPRDHERFAYPDERLLDDCLRSLALINPRFRPDWVMDWAVSRDPYAQVICTTGFADRVPSHETPIENLFVIDSTQLYPADRTISGTIDLARNVADLIERPATAVERARRPSPATASAAGSSRPVSST